MTIDLSQLVLFGIFCSSLHWLIARSEIGRPFWSRARGWFGALLACAGCSGFWIGSVIGGAGLSTPVSLDVNSILYADVALRALVHGVLGIFVTPVFEAAMLWGLDMSAIASSETTEEPGAIPEAIPQTNSALVTPISNPKRQP